MSPVAARPVVILALAVCALVGHLWMHAEPVLPEPVAAATAVPADMGHGDDGQDRHHVMALACVAVLVMGALVVRQRTRVALVARVAACFAADRTHWRAARASSQPRSAPDRVEAGITLLI